MHKGSCHQAYKDGQVQRLAHPLVNGRYKLVEGAHRLENALQTLCEVRGYINSSEHDWWASGCDSFDKHIWLRRLPSEVAYRMGYELIPGLLALKGDGAEPAAIRAIYPSLQMKCHRVIEELESARRLCLLTIEIEYDAMRAGGSYIEAPVKEAVRLFQFALSALEVHPGT